MCAFTIIDFFRCAHILMLLRSAIATELGDFFLSLSFLDGLVTLMWDSSGPIKSLPIIMKSY